MESVSNPLQACRDIVLKPNRVFAKLANTDNWSWLPFFLIVGFSLLPIYYYFQIIDFNWYKELIIQSTAANISPNEQNILRNNMSPNTIMMTTCFGMVLSLIITNAILAVYLNLCSRADQECVMGFTDWYGFAWWISLPSIVASIISFLLIVVASTPQLEPIWLSPTSLGFLFSVDNNSIWFSLSQSIRLENFWIMYLTAVGLSQWTNLAPKRTYIIAIGPYAVIWGVWLVALLVK